MASNPLLNDLDDDSASSLESQDQLPSQNGPARLLACYLLVSLSPKRGSKNRTYIGFTVDPTRRIRQHNGEVTAGARRTSRHRPWEMIAVVHGFSSKTQALQFEWAWQNSEKCIPVKWHHGRPDALPLPKTRIHTPSGCLQRLAALLSVPPWSHCPLTPTITAKREDWGKWGIDKIKFPGHKQVEHGTIEEFRSGPYNYRGKLNTTPIQGPCGVCCKPTFDRAQTFCAGCGTVSHLSCMARSSAGATSRMLPDCVTCPSCENQMHWSVVVRTCKALEEWD